MLYTASIIIPDVGQHEASEFLHPYLLEKYARAEAEAGWKIENVRFEHDPDWNKHFLSIQSAHDQNHPGWMVIGWLARNVYMASALGQLTL